MNKVSTKKILIIVTGGIASYKALDLIRKLQEENVDCECILTENAKKFVQPLAFESLLGKKIYTNLFTLDNEKKMLHINISSDCDAIAIVPCTANFLAKIANGNADDLATNVLMAYSGKKIIAPAMNTNMWNNLAVKKNIEVLNKMQVLVLQPDSGRLACGTIGKGKLMDVEKIANNILNSISEEKKLFNKKVVITAGPSVEKIDPIRFISNRSSGLQGIEIAKFLNELGANVTLICGPTPLKLPSNLNVIKVESARDFLKESLDSLPCDIFISVAAITDWECQDPSNNKIKKKENNFQLQLKQTPDILQIISQHEVRPKLVIGFSAETQNLRENSQFKFLKKKCDMIVANLVGDTKGFGDKKNKVFFMDKKIKQEWPNLEKRKIAIKLSKKIVSFFKRNKL